MEWYVKVWKDYAVFRGRAHRTEYWMFVLYNFMVTVILVLLDAIAGHTDVLEFLYALAIAIPSSAVAMRRLHDTGRSGWWLWIGLIPIIGQLILLVFLVQEGTSGGNEYGPDPWQVAAGRTGRPA